MKVCRLRQISLPLALLTIRYCGVLNSHIEFFNFNHMASLHLPNYLRAHRKRLGLSQDEVAFLLGAVSGAKVSRYERFVRGASFETALACEAVFKRPASELFAGLYKKIEKEVAARAETLALKINERKADRRTARKRQTLTDMAILQTKKPLKQ